MMRWLKNDTPIGRAVAHFRDRSGPSTLSDGNGRIDEIGQIDSVRNETRGPEASGAPSWGDGRTGWTTGEENPFLQQRHEFHNRFYDLAAAKRNWQIATFLALAALLVVSGGYVYLASSSRIHPYVVEVSELGQARAFGPADELPRSQLDRAVTAEIAEFITNARRVVGDIGAQREIIVDAYAFADEKTQRFLNHFYSQEENDPRFLSSRIRRQVAIESILKLPETDSYKVRWVERETGLVSGSTIRTSWEAVLAVRIEPPETEAEILANPLGVKITDINWSQIHTIEE